MWISRFAVPFALALAFLFAFLAPEDAEREADTVSAREALGLAQRAGGSSYTFSRTTAALLERAELPRPAADATREELEASLREAGFVLSPVGPDADLVRVEPGG